MSVRKASRSRSMAMSNQRNSENRKRQPSDKQTLSKNETALSRTLGRSDRSKIQQTILLRPSVLDRSKTSLRSDCSSA